MNSPSLKWRNHYALILAAMWTAVIALLFIWHRAEISRNIQTLARVQAANSFEKDLVYRRWAANHGGVYVPPTKESPPNPYLSHIETRDITTTDGMNLTLMNPAYMTRQVHELEKKQYGHQAHITSLNPLRPMNAPDAWEAKALKKFKRGETEVVEVAGIEGEDCLRLMRPMITEKRCLKCHASQGYQEGDIRGGICVSVPMAPMRSVVRDHISTIAKVYAMIWLLGLVGLGFGSWRIRNLIYQRGLADQTLRKSESSHRQLLQNLSAGVVVHAPDTRIMLHNQAAEKLLGMTAEQMTGKAARDPGWRFVHEDGRPMAMEDYPVAQVKKNLLSLTNYILGVDHSAGATRVWVLVNAYPEFDERRELRQIVVSFVDITERKRAEMTMIEQLDELRRWRDVMVTREDRVIEVKREVNELLARLDEPPRYAIILNGEPKV